MLNGQGNGDKKRSNQQEQQHLCSCSTLVLYIIFFVVVLNDYIVKRSSNVLWRKLMSYVLIEKKNVASCSCSLSISLPPIFTLPFAKISHFLTNALKFSCCVADEAFLIYFYLWLQIFLYLLSRSMLVLSLLSTSAQTLKCSRKKTWLCCRFFSLKVQVVKMTITRTFIIKLNAGCSLHTK